MIKKKTVAVVFSRWAECCYFFFWYLDCTYLDRSDLRDQYCNTSVLHVFYARATHVCIYQFVLMSFHIFNVCLVVLFMFDHGSIKFVFAHHMFCMSLCDSVMYFLYASVWMPVHWWISSCMWSCGTVTVGITRQNAQRTARENTTTALNVKSYQRTAWNQTTRQLTTRHNNYKTQQNTTRNQQQ